ncbi:MgtC/SapB family protein [Paenibacillus antri]|uniref:MgtC/SapB family protein n=1 Tax=Paenibacillus antri TaxID=2582848 RepID=A0A5R9GH44_9BACL|nr:MgtC/SapB family protein [Paenibacillus antri]TLS50755.1 MgtC/SapB family protein [Paenibacillus antri]
MIDLLGQFAAEPASVWEISAADLTVRMVLAVVLGGIIGLEREWSNHAAGFRTHILVCIGSASIMLLSIYGFSEFVHETNVRIDPARLSAQVISGIGFLGAGAIMRHGLTVSGLTTAASIWVVAAIGLCAGAGFYYGAILCTILVFIILQVLNRWEKKMRRSRIDPEMTVKVTNRPGILGQVAIEFGAQGIHVSNVKIVQEERSATDEPEQAPTLLVFRIKIESGERLLAAVDCIRALEGVLSIDLNHPLYRNSPALPKTKYSVGG